MEILGQLAAVATVFALLGLSLWWLRRRGFASPVLARRSEGRLLKAVERLPLGPQHTLHLVRLGEKTLVVACSPAGCALLASFGRREIETLREAER